MKILREFQGRKILNLGWHFKQSIQSKRDPSPFSPPVSYLDESFILKISIDILVNQVPSQPDPLGRSAVRGLDQWCVIEVYFKSSLIEGKVNSLISIAVTTSNAVCPKRTPAACDLILAIRDYKDIFSSPSAREYATGDG